MSVAPSSRSDLDPVRIDWRQVDATTDAEIDHQADADTAPVCSEAELLAAGQRFEPAAVTRALAGER